MASNEAVKKIPAGQETHERARCVLHCGPGWKYVMGPSQIMAVDEARGIIVPAEAVGRKCSFGELQQLRPEVLS